MKHTRLIIMLLLMSVFSMAWADNPTYRAQRHELFKVLPVKTNSIVFVGNSITDLGRFTEFFGDEAQIINRGIEGIASQEVIDHIAEYVSGKPQALFLMIGINDYQHPEVVVPNIRKIVEIVKNESPSTHIYIQNILPCPSRATTPTTLNPQIEALCQALNSEGKTVTYIDLYTAFGGSLTDTYDNLHPNAFGYRTWCNEIKDEVGTELGHTATVSLRDEITAVHVNNSGFRHYSLLESEYQMLTPLTSSDMIHVGDLHVNCAEWSELMGTPHFKTRGIGYNAGYRLDIFTTASAENNHTGIINGTPSKVFFQCGRADVDAGATVETIKTRYDAALAELKAAAPGATIYIESLIPSTDATVNANKIVPVNEYIASLADGTNVIFVDVYNALVSGGVMNPLYQGGDSQQDGTHCHTMNGYGYIAWANALKTATGTTTPRDNYTADQIALNDTYFDALSYVYNHADEVPAESTLRTELASAPALIASGNGTDCQAKKEAISSALSKAKLGNIKISTDEVAYCYTFVGKRNNQYVGVDGTTVKAFATSNGRAQEWVFTENENGGLNIQNAKTLQYIVPGTGSSNSCMTTSETEPSKGWTFNEVGEYYTIVSDANQMNVQNTTGTVNLYNWGGGTNITDLGCLFSIALVETIDGGLSQEWNENSLPENGKVYTIYNDHSHTPYYLTGAMSNNTTALTTTAPNTTPQNTYKWIVWGDDTNGYTIYNVDTKAALRGDGKNNSHENATGPFFFRDKRVIAGVAFGPVANGTYLALQAGDKNNMRLSGGRFTEGATSQAIFNGATAAPQWSTDFVFTPTGEYGYKVTAPAGVQITIGESSTTYANDDFCISNKKLTASDIHIATEGYEAQVVNNTITVSVHEDLPENLHIYTIKGVFSGNVKAPLTVNGTTIRGGAPEDTPAKFVFISTTKENNAGFTKMYKIGSVDGGYINNSNYGTLQTTATPIAFACNTSAGIVWDGNGTNKPAAGCYAMVALYGDNTQYRSLATQGTTNGTIGVATYTSKVYGQNTLVATGNWSYNWIFEEDTDYEAYSITSTGNATLTRKDGNTDIITSTAQGNGGYIVVAKGVTPSKEMFTCSQEGAQPFTLTNAEGEQITIDFSSDRTYTVTVDTDPDNVKDNITVTIDGVVRELDVPFTVDHVLYNSDVVVTCPDGYGFAAILEGSTIKLTIHKMTFLPNQPYTMLTNCTQNRGYMAYNPACTNNFVGIADVVYNSQYAAANASSHDRKVGMKWYIEENPIGIVRFYNTKIKKYLKLYNFHEEFTGQYTYSVWTENREEASTFRYGKVTRNNKEYYEFYPTEKATGTFVLANYCGGNTDNTITHSAIVATDNINDNHSSWTVTPVGNVTYEFEFINYPESGAGVTIEGQEFDTYSAPMWTFVDALDLTDVTVNTPPVKYAYTPTVYDMDSGGNKFPTSSLQVTQGKVQVEYFTVKHGHAYTLAVRSKDGSKVWYLKNDGTVSENEADAEVFVAGSTGREDDYTTLFATNNNQSSKYLQYQGATATQYAKNSCDFIFEPFQFGEYNNTRVNATVPQRYGTFYLKAANRTSGTATGVLTIRESNQGWENTSDPYLDGALSSAIEIHEVPYPYNKPNFVMGNPDEHEGGYASIWLPFPMKFSDGIEVYKGTTNYEDLLILEQVNSDDIVAAGGYILRDPNQTADKVEQLVLPAPGNGETMVTPKDEAQAFVGSTENPLVVKEAVWNTFAAKYTGTPYVLAKKTSGMGFYKYNDSGNFLPKGKAIWFAPTANAEAVKFGFREIVEAIKALNGESTDVEIYDLQGHRLNKVEKGQINVINGKKVMFK